MTMTVTSSPIKRWRRASGRTRIRLTGQAAFIAALLAGRTWPTLTPYAVAVFIAGAVLTIAAIRPADRGKP